MTWLDREECKCRTSARRIRVASQDEPILWAWQRDAATNAFSELPIEIKGHDAVLSAAQPDLSIPLTDLYRGIGVA
jgi:hypothetical protein